MPGRLATVISKLLGSVFGDSSKSPLQKRIEWLRVNQEFHGGRYQVDGGGKSGQAMVTGRNPGYRVGNVVPVVMDGRAPVAIVGHETLKAQFHPSGVAVEQVEEIIMTRTSHPDGGLDFFLRSWRGLFYLDFRAAVSAVVPDPAKFLDTFVAPGTRFPLQSGEQVRFGFNDNVLGILVASSNNNFGVIYIFKINRPLHSDQMPVSGDPYILSVVEYPRVDLSLLAIYDLSTTQIQTDITITNIGSVGYHQGYYDLLVLRTGVWNPSPPGGYDIAADIALSFDFSTPVNKSFPFDETVSVVIDFAHWQDLVSGQIHPYQWEVEHFWIGPGDHPFLAVALENSYGLPSAPFNRLARDASGTLIPAQDIVNPSFNAGAMSPAIITVGSRDLAEHAALVVRLDLENGLVGGEMLARSCPASLAISTTTDYTDNVPGRVLPGSTIGTCLGTHTVQQVLSGGGPTDGTSFIRVTDYLFIFSTIPPGLPSFGAATTTEQEPGTYASTLPKDVLIPFFTNAPTVGSLGSTVWHVVVSGVLAEFTHTMVLISFVGVLPGAFWLVQDAICRPKSLTDVDVLLLRAIVEGPRGWRVQAGVDSLVIYPTGAPGIGIFNKPHLIINRDFILFEGSRLCSIDGSSVVHFPTEFGPSAGSIFALVAPDRLYDERDSVGKFRSTDDPASILAKPKPLPSIAALSAFTLFLSTPPDILHTVGTRTDKMSG